MKNLLWIVGMLFASLGTAFSANPVFVLTATQAAPTTLYAGQTATAIYQVMNNTPFTLNHSGVVNLPAGVTVSGGTCGNPFNLAANASCTVNLLITASQLKGNLTSGPEVCNTVDHPIYCAYPAPDNQLNVTLVAPPAPGNTTLSVASPTTVQTLEANGSATVSVTITNTGSASASHVQMTTPWSGVTLTPSSCGTIAAGSSCIFTIQSSTPNLAGQITIQGTNTNTVTTPYIAFTLHSYLVYAVNTGSMTANVIDTHNDSTGIAWDSSSACSSGTCVATGAISLTDGQYLDSAGNTYEIISGPNSIGTQTGSGGNAAATCYNIASDNTGTVANGTWYLPAICEMGGAGQGAGCASGISNIDANLFQRGFSAIATGDNYWSSTEDASNPTLVALSEAFNLGGSTQDNTTKVAGFHVICARLISYPIP